MKNLIVRLASLAIADKQKRRAFREKYLTPEKYKMKLGISYSLFDGEELLEASLNSVRSCADYINVVYQKTSYYGEPAAQGVEALLNRLKEQGLIDEIILFEPDLKLKGGENEYRKRNVGFEAARSAGCDWFLGMDVDEFYFAEEVEKAKQYVLKHKIDASAVRFINYIKEPTYQWVSNQLGFVPFLIKILPGRKLGRNQRKMPIEVDPTRGVVRFNKFWLFMDKEIVMHHMTAVRKDMRRKFINSSLNDCADYRAEREAKMNEILELKLRPGEIKRWEGGFLREVPNQFDIKID